MDERPLLVLDLDETLLHATETRLTIAPHHHEVGPYFLYLRPGLAAFLEQIALAYRLAVWTSSSPSYARKVCALIFTDPGRLEFMWASDRCTPIRDVETDIWFNAKRLRKLKRRGYDLVRVLVVDDSPEKHTRNYGNLVQVAPFTGDPADDELFQLGLYLSELAVEPNFRRIDKREWRRRFTAAQTHRPD
jgi:RNA polymerase II subunit A small phosphatase-like protein